jgi:hypothetical protein
MNKKLVIGCNYHTTWQAHKAMRFVLSAIDKNTNRALLYTRHTKKCFWTSIDSLIFIETKYNQAKADRLINEKEKKEDV